MIRHATLGRARALDDGGVYVDAIGGDVTAAASRRRTAVRQLERLRELKRTWDPGNLFRLNHNIEP